MRVQLEQMNYLLKNPYTYSKRVEVHFTYEVLDHQKIRLHLNATIGEGSLKDSFRFLLNLVYFVDLDGVTYVNEDDMVQNAIDCILPSFKDLITLLDMLIVENEGH